MAEFRLFLSAVSSEFTAARDTLAASLRAREMHIAVQSDFRQQEAADTTLRKLHDYIRDCSAVVCVMGTRSGGMSRPPPRRPSRRAPAIDEASLGKDHPNVATHLNNLARLLQDTSQLTEAEPLMRRMLAIFLTFRRNTAHVHPHRDAAIGNYIGLLAAMGKSQPEIDAAIEALHREAGLDRG
jgi:Tetratricopeptide repeat/Domain of unknown function (DUF4062)